MNDLVDTYEPAALVEAPLNEDIRSTVNQMENIQKWVPIAILAALFGYPVLSSLVSGSLVGAIFIGIVMFIVAGLVILVVEKIIIAPMRHIRYKRAANTLGKQVQAVPKPVNQWRCWWTGAPGALAVTSDGELLIVDRSTDYTHLWLDRSQLLNVSVEREATQITNTKHSGRVTFGGGGSFFGAYTMGGRSRSVTKTLENAFLEIRYQLERNGPTYTSVIPFGSERRAADELCATITRLERPA